MNFDQRLVINRLLVKIEARKMQLYEIYDEHFNVRFDYYPDWNLGSEIANDWVIKNLSLQLNEYIAPFLKK